MESRRAYLGIPSQFELLNHTIRVKEIPEPSELEKNGDFCAEALTIRLWTHDVPDSLILHTFYHELMHAVFYFTGYEEDNHDEAKVDRIGGLLAQYHSSLL